MADRNLLVSCSLLEAASPFWDFGFRIETSTLEYLQMLSNVLPMGFYPNVTTLRSGLCYRNSVCRLSVVCLSYVTLVYPTQVVEPFGKISSPLCTLDIL